MVNGTTKLLYRDTANKATLSASTAYKILYYLTADGKVQAKKDTATHVLGCTKATGIMKHINCVKFTGPGTHPEGVSWANYKIWHVDCWTGKAYRLTPTGTVETSWASPAGDPQDIYFDGMYLWIAEHFANKVYKCNLSGGVISSFNSPDTDCQGISGNDSNRLYIAGEDEICITNLSGGVINRWGSPSTDPQGMGYEEGDLWHTDYNAHKIYKLDTSGNVLRSFNSPTGGSVGVTYGVFLWYVDCDVDKKFYKLDVFGNQL